MYMYSVITVITEYNQVVSTGKEKEMNEPMTDYQFKTILKMFLDILNSSNDIEEAKTKVYNLLEDEQNKK